VKCLLLPIKVVKDNLFVFFCSVHNQAIANAKYARLQSHASLLKACFATVHKKVWIICGRIRVLLKTAMIIACIVEIQVCRRCVTADLFWECILKTLETYFWNKPVWLPYWRWRSASLVIPLFCLKRIRESLSKCWPDQEKATFDFTMRSRITF